MPTDRPSSSKRPTRRASSSVGEGPVSDKLQSFEFERASDNDFGAGLSDDTRSPSRDPGREPSRSREPSREPASEAPASDEGTRRRRTIAGKPRVIAPEPAPASEPPRSTRASSSAEDDRRPRENDDRGERFSSERSSDEGDRGDSTNQDRGDDGGRRPRRRRRGRGGEGQSGPGQRSNGPRSIAARAPASSRTPSSGHDRGGSSRSPSDRGGQSDRGQSSSRGTSDRGPSSVDRYARSPQRTPSPSQPQSEGRRGERRSLSSPTGDRQTRYLQHAPFPTGDVVGELEPMSGVLELHPKGYGFLRLAKNDYGAEESDAFVSGSLIEKHKLRDRKSVV